MPSLVRASQEHQHGLSPLIHCTHCLRIVCRKEGRVALTRCSASYHGEAQGDGSTGTDRPSRIDEATMVKDAGEEYTLLPSGNGGKGMRRRVLMLVGCVD